MRGIARGYLWMTWLTGVGILLIVVVGLVQSNVPWTLVAVDVSLCVTSGGLYRRYRRLARNEESASDG
jgi:hypothetical protein